jgi:hypothetical protein
MVNQGYPGNPGGNPGGYGQQPMAGTPQPTQQYPQGPNAAYAQMGHPGAQQQQPMEQTGRGPVSPISRVPLERTFQINYFSESEERQYAGTFVVRRPNIRQQARITARHSEILGGFYYDPDNPGYGVPVDMDILAEMMAFLDLTVIEGPEWFHADDMYDPGLIYAIYGEAVKVDPFRVYGSTARQSAGLRESSARAAPQPSPGLGGGEGNPERNQPGHNDSIEAMVDTSVQTPDDKPGVG